MIFLRLRYKMMHLPWCCRHTSGGTTSEARRFGVFPIVRKDVSSYAWDELLSVSQPANDYCSLLPPRNVSTRSFPDLVNSTLLSTTHSSFSPGHKAPDIPRRRPPIAALWLPVTAANVRTDDDNWNLPERVSLGQRVRGRSIETAPPAACFPEPPQGRGLHNLARAM